MCKTRARSDRYRFQFTLVVLMLFSAFSPPVYAQKVSKIYWTDDGTNKIQRANLDGSGIEDLVTTGLDQPEMIALDAGRAKMYWTDAGVDKIRRANFDGSNVEDCNVVGIQFVPNNPRGLALDLKNNKKYWTETHSPQNISRANLDGTKGEDLIKDPAVLPQPRGLAIDVQGNRMYWTDDSQHFIRCADLDGSNISDVITSGLNQPVGIALHLTANKLYFADEGSGRVKRADLDGLNVEDCVTGLGNPFHIALDFEGGKVYWTDRVAGKIQRANLDCTRPVENVITGLSSPRGIALGPDMAVPAVSEWGLVVLTLLIAAAGTIAVMKRHRLAV